MRIISGIYKNQALATPGDGTHPMGERERNALFNTLVSLYLETAETRPAPLPFAGAQVLDLFAGSGALGFEALSRGAAHVTFVENASRAVKTLRQNAEKLQIPPDQYEIIKSDALTYVPGQTFNLVFCDPPYPLVPQIDFSFLLPLLSPASLLVLSLPASLALIIPNLEIVSDKTYASCKILITRLRQE